MEQRGHGPANILILDFWPPEPRENKYVLNHPVCGVCYGSPSKLIQLGIPVCVSLHHLPSALLKSQWEATAIVKDVDVVDDKEELQNWAILPQVGAPI